MLGAKQICRVRIAKEELEKMTKEDFHKTWLLQEQYIDCIESKLHENVDQTELATLRESEEKLKQQQLESTRRENILVMRLTTKEQEMQDYAGQVQELKQAQIPSIAQLRSAMLDPAINLMFEKMSKEIDSLKARLEETQNELNAWKFTPDSNTGKRLMAKCRLLYQENEELGKMISSGKMAKLEGDLALQKTFSEEMKKCQSELDEFLLELDEDVEGMQSTICYLQQQLRESKDLVVQLQKEKSTGLSIDSTPNHCLSKAENLSTANSSDNLFVSTEPCGTNETVEPRDTVTPPLIEPKKLQENAVPVTAAAAAAGGNSSHAWSPPQFLQVKPEPPSPPPEPQQRIEKKIKQESLSPPPKAAKAETKSVPTSVVVCHQHPVVRGSLHVEEYDSEQELDVTSSTMDDHSAASDGFLMDSPRDKPGSHPADPINLKVAEPTNKRTSENGSRGRKRTRVSRNMLNIVEEDNYRSEQPAFKRLRRRNIIVEPSSADSDHKRTSAPLEINTDTEVQVAQTLAWLASTKQERKEVLNKTQDLVSESLGNGELKGNMISDENV